VSIVINEFAKLRHLHIGLIALILTAAVVGMALVGAASGGADVLTWPSVLAGTSLAFPMASPLLIAVIASRAVDMEHEGSGWLAGRAAGVGPGRMCRAKLVTTGIVVLAATVAASGVLLLLGSALGAASAPPLGLWLGHTAAVCLVNLALLGLQILISALIDNQLVALGFGVVGTIVAAVSTGLPTWLAALTPWGHYSLAAAAGYRGEALVTLTPTYGAVAALTVIAAVIFTAMTHHLDAAEA